MQDIEKIIRLCDIIKNGKKIVFFGGAGVSTESGVPDFRSVDGLYNMKYDYPPETILSHTFFMNKPEEFYRFYRDKMLIEGVKPNAAHKALAELEEMGKLTAVITQNIDGLHQLAGSKNVYELHGTVHKNRCMKCGKKFDFEYIVNYQENIPKCDKCGGMIKPEVVLYEEGLDDDVVSGAVRKIREADVMIVGGTSLVVYPAAGLLRYFNGSDLVLINKSSTAMDSMANLVINEGIGEVFTEVMKRLKNNDN